MIKYLGSKRTLVPDLVRLLDAVPELSRVADLFSGTSRVGHAFKAAGRQVIANDHNAYAHVLATCYVQADRERVERDAERLLVELSRVRPRAGYFTETFCRRARFFQPKNGERIDAMRDEIAAKGLDPELEAVLLVALMEAADRVDSTCGVQMAYVKSWASRSHKELALRMPKLLPRPPAGPCEARCEDAERLAGTLVADVAYLDPPYNQHSYLGNYHIWETLIRWDAPEVYGVACKRVDCRERKSAFNSKRKHAAAFRALIETLDVPLLVVSFSDEGFQSRSELEALLKRRGVVYVFEKDFKRYVGAQIGIFSPRGERVGKVSHLRNTENIFVVVTPEAERRVPDVHERMHSLRTGAAPRRGELFDA